MKKHTKKKLIISGITIGFLILFGCTIGYIRGELTLDYIISSFTDLMFYFELGITTLYLLICICVVKWVFRSRDKIFKRNP